MSKLIQKTATKNNGVAIKTARKPVECVDVSTSEYDKDGVQTAQLRQSVIEKREYESSDSFNDSLFDNLATTSMSNTSTRVAFIPVPEGTTVEEVNSMIPENACIQRIMSSSPILSEGDKVMIAKGNITLHQKALSQVVRDSTGEIVKDQEGRYQYKRLAFKKNFVKDVDGRGKGKEFLLEDVTAQPEGSAAILSEEEFSDF